MSDEEKKAVGKLETLIQYLSVWNENFTIVPADMKYLVPIFNLITKQSKEIEHQKEKRENQKKELAILNAKQIEFNKLVNTVNSYKGQFKRQQKEIEELKEKNEPQPDCTEPVERAEEMVNMTWVNYHYISKEEYENAIKTTFKVCNKHWEDKIEEKIEEVHYKMIGHQDLREAVKETLKSLSEKEN